MVALWAACSALPQAAHWRRERSCCGIQAALVPGSIRSRASRGSGSGDLFTEEGAGRGQPLGVQCWSSCRECSPARAQTRGTQPAEKRVGLPARDPWARPSEGPHWAGSVLQRKARERGETDRQRDRDRQRQRGGQRDKVRERQRDRKTER